MRRRAFSLQLASLAGIAGPIGLLLPQTMNAQGAVPVEGQQYVKLAQPVPVAGNGKLDLIEFFWYGCPHCNAFEPFLEPWVKKLPDGVAFRRVHVAFDALKEIHQRLYYTLEVMGAVDAMHAKVFARFHAEHKPINREADAVAFATANGLDGTKFLASWNSFSVQTRMRQGKALSEAYRLDGVPTLGIHGRYTTSPAMANGNAEALQVCNYLINQARKAG